MKRISIAAVLLAFGLTAVSAQTPEVLEQRAPNMPRPEDVPAEKMEPGAPVLGDPSTTGSTETLSEKLERSDGVIRPPETATPDITVPAPVPNPGTTPVIPPPGSPGGNPRIDPK